MLENAIHLGYLCNCCFSVHTRKRRGFLKRMFKGHVLIILLPLFLNGYISISLTKCVDFITLQIIFLPYYSLSTISFKTTVKFNSLICAGIIAGLPNVKAIKPSYHCSGYFGPFIGQEVKLNLCPRRVFYKVIHHSFLFLHQRMKINDILRKVLRRKTSKGCSKIIASCYPFRYDLSACGQKVTRLLRTYFCFSVYVDAYLSFALITSC